MKAQVIGKRTNEFDGKTSTTLQILVDRRKVWADAEMLNAKADAESVDVDTTQFCLVKKSTANGTYLKLMPKLSMELSEV